MAVFETLAFDVKPGRRADFLAVARDIKANCERVDVGLKSFRFVEALMAGPNVGRVTLVAEYADLASWSTSIEREEQDAEINALVARAFGPDSSFTLASRSLLTEIDL